LLFFSPLFDAPFLGVVPRRHWDVFFVDLDAIWESFGRLFVAFGEFAGFCWMALPLMRKPIFSGFGGPRSALLRPHFQARIPGCVFNGFYTDFCDFGSPLGSLLAPFGPPFFGKLATRFRIGEKVASGVAKESLLGAFWSPFGRLFGDISEDSGPQFDFPFLSHALDIPWVFVYFLSGTL